MPRAARSSRAVKKHETAIPLEKPVNEIEMLENDDEQQSADDSELSEDEAGEDAEETMNGVEEPETVQQATKKSKKKDKRAALMRKLAESAIPVSPYSKSHRKRMKKKAKESMKLGAITAALAETLPEEPTPAAETLQNKPKTAELHSMLETERKKQTSTARPAALKKPTSPGKIGADTSRKNLTAKQRQKMLQTEKNRLPAILAHKSFAASPFETIRLHAQNTVVPLEKSRRA